MNEIFYKISLCGVDLSRLEPKSLQNKPILKDIDLSESAFNEELVNAKLYLPELEFINLRKMNISEEIIKKHIHFSKFTKLKDIDLSENQIENIYENFFSNNQILNKLYLSNNKILFIGSDSFALSLRILDLSHNN
jgi:Leucine-rich repeat (LRR) protein